MTTEELLEKSGIQTNGEKLPVMSGMAMKAGDIKPGDVFVALKGAQKDGVDFIPEAVKNGAVLVLAERKVEAKVPVIVVENLREKVSKLAALIYPSPKITKLAVTGTNGKTSTVFYVQQILNLLGIPAASIGTVGTDFGNIHISGSMTTPDAVTLNKELQQLENQGVQVVAMEASSHGLEQGRLEGLTLSAMAFTNLTQDHLDYHKTMEAYRQAKGILFSHYGHEGAVAVLNADDPSVAYFKELAKKTKCKMVLYGKTGADFKLDETMPTPDGQDIQFDAFGKKYRVHLAISGDFQPFNIFAAMGLCLAVPSVTIEKMVEVLPKLKAPAGRLELMGIRPNGARIFVDYAHTPDAVEQILKTLRRQTVGRLICLMGCGGNRDTAKRPLMGKTAAELADVVYITNDNPRFENPADIRAAIKAACPNGIESDNREKAIHQAISALQANDVLVIAGKGHEPGQTVAGITYAMDDRIEAGLALLSDSKTPIWTADELELALTTSVSERIKVYGISIDTRTLALGDMFIAIKGDKCDGHDYVKKAVEKGAAVCIVDHLVNEVPADKQIVVSDTMSALESLAQFARMRSQALIVGITGSSGKTTTKEMLKACLSAQGKTHATSGNFNNQIGVPLTLARMPKETQYGVIEMGMNHQGELMHLSHLVRPDVTIITSIGSAHREFFPTEQDVAVAKSEIFDYQNRQGFAVLNADSPFYDFLKQAAEGQDIQHIVSFGIKNLADFSLKSSMVTGEKTEVVVSHCAQEVRYTLSFLGDHYVADSLGVLAVVDSVGGDWEKAAQTLETVHPADGRGALVDMKIDGKQIFMIDDAYNANPSSMAASLLSLGLRQGGRKIAVLGDMLELGDLSQQMHEGLLPYLQQAGIDKVYTVGPMMHHLYEKLPAKMQGYHSDIPVDMLKFIKQDLQNHDFVLIKSSHGTGLYKLVAELKGLK